MEQKKNSGLGIAGFILSLIGCGSFLGVIFSIIALATSKKNNTKIGFPIAGLIIGLFWTFAGGLFLILMMVETPTVSDEVLNMNENDFKSTCVTMAYDDLFRNIEQNEGKYLKFKGEIQQVIYDGDTKSEYLISVTDNDGWWEDNIYVVLDRTKVNDKFLEDDVVTFYGECYGAYSYTTVLGSSEEVPEVHALYMELNK
jgi:hypothetical protein